MHVRNSVLLCGNACCFLSLMSYINNRVLPVCLFDMLPTMLRPPTLVPRVFCLFSMTEAKYPGDDGREPPTPTISQRTTSIYNKTFILSVCKAKPARAA